MHQGHRPLRDSAPRHPAGAVAAGAPRGHERLAVTLVLRAAELDAGHPLHRKIAARDALAPRDRPVLSAAEFATRHRAEGAHVAAVLAFARRFGLDVVELAPRRHDVILAGPVRLMRRAFAVELQHYEYPYGRYRGHAGEVNLPAGLHEAVIAVLGLDEIPVRRSRPACAAHSTRTLRSPRDIARHYRFPPRASGAGQRIAILAFGGGAHRLDLAHYFGHVLRVQPPRLRHVSVLGARSAPLAMGWLRPIIADLADGADDMATLTARYGDRLLRAVETIETTMDIELAGAIANGAEIAVYYAPNSNRGYYHALYAALGMAPDRVSRRNRLPAAIAVSWGAPEAQWPAGALVSIHGALEKAKDLGVTVCCASGDFGPCASPDDRSRVAVVNFPASSPFALACGGTTLRRHGAGTPTREQAWNQEYLGLRMATGGGVSGFFARPSFQDAAGVPVARAGATWLGPAHRGRRSFAGRAVPDVSAHADSESGYRLHVGGQALPGGGTSAVAPVWAALIALLAQRLGAPPGWLNAQLYREPVRSALRSVRRGDNDVTDGRVPFARAHAGWNACCGLGTPRGDRLLEGLRMRRGATSGTPATAL